MGSTLFNTADKNTSCLSFPDNNNLFIIIASINLPFKLMHLSELSDRHALKHLHVLICIFDMEMCL